MINERTTTRPGFAGFTLIELMVVIFIIGIMVALVVGVGKYVFDEAARKETRATLALVQAAVDDFREITGDYPADSEPASTCDDNSAALLVWWFQCNGVAQAATIPPLTDAQARQVQAKCRDDCLLKLPGDALDATGQTIQDAWGTSLTYDADGGFGGKAVVISAGPDVTSDTDDDIRSDR
jgi:prepilin-type N-terminal cleavage/methylation domain-containing protein